MENLLILSYLSSFVMILSIHLHSYHRRISICFIDGNLSGWTGHRFVSPSFKRYDLYALLHARNAYLITLIPLMAIEQSRSMYHFHKVRSNRTFFFSFLLRIFRLFRSPFEKFEQISRTFSIERVSCDYLAWFNFATQYFLSLSLSISPDDDDVRRAPRNFV